MSTDSIRPLVDKSRHTLLVDILSFHNWLVYQANYGISVDKNAYSTALQVFDNWVMGLKTAGTDMTNDKERYVPRMIEIEDSMTKSTWSIYKNIAGCVAKCDKCGFVHVIDTKKTRHPPTYCPSCAYRYWAEKEKETDHTLEREML